MSKIWFIKCETEFGPFFSSLEKVREYLSNPDHRPDQQDGEVDNLNEIMDGTNPYMNVIEVELDKMGWENVFGG